MKQHIAQRVLFITSTRLGDAILSTGIMNTLHAQYPEARFEIVCGGLPASLFERCPYVDKIHILTKRKDNGHWMDLWKILWSKRWSVIVDLRSTFVTWLVPARKHYVFGNHINQKQHKVKQFQDLLKADMPPKPVLWPLKAEGAAFIPDGAPVLALAPSSNWHAKTWPEERFIELVKRLQAGIFAGWRLAVFAAPNEADQVQSIMAAFPDAIDMIGKGNPAQVASAMAQCDYFIGNDSGLMHMACALGIKTLGLFGPTYDLVYGPWGKNTSFVRTKETVEQLLDIPNYNSKTCPNLMESLSVDDVEEGVIKLLTS